jgi:hypothetical protein
MGKLFFVEPLRVTDRPCTPLGRGCHAVKGVGYPAKGSPKHRSKILVDHPVNIDTVKLGLLHADGVREILIWLRPNSGFPALSAHKIPALASIATYGLIHSLPQSALITNITASKKK